MEPLPNSAPADQQVAAAGVVAFIDELERNPDIEAHSLVVLRHGYVVAAGWWHPFGPQRPHMLYSLSKSFTSTALAFGVAEGLVGLDDRVVDHFPEHSAVVTSEATRRMTVRHLASMATGHVSDMWRQSNDQGGGDPVRGFLSYAPEREPGSVFAYNQSATYALGAILQRRSGSSLTAYLAPRLLDRFGVAELGWQQQPRGVDLAFSGLFATTSVVACLGQLYLGSGQWEGQQLLPLGWVPDASSVHIPTSEPVDVPPGAREEDWLQGYGYQFWMSRHGYRGDGYLGQFCLVLPEQDAVVAVTSRTGRMQAVLDAAWEHLLPALEGRGGAGPDADHELALRLAALCVPVPAAVLGAEGRAEGVGLGPGAPRADEVAAWCGEYRPRPGDNQQPSLGAVTLVREEAGWLAVLADRGARVQVRFGRAEWAVSEGPVPNAGAGWWPAPGRLEVDVLMLEAPHRLVLELRRADKTFSARWSSVPLRAESLADLACPA